jgi:hypothetical protein
VGRSSLLFTKSIGHGCAAKTVNHGVGTDQLLQLLCFSSIPQLFTMAPQLPQQPNDLCVVLPQAPADLPVFADVYRTTKLKHNVFDSAGECSVYHILPCPIPFILTMPSLIASNNLNASTPDDVGRAVVYEHSVVHMVTAGAIGPGS